MNQILSYLLSYQIIMLKHKIRKSRKNILSLLETVKDDEEDRGKENIPEYSEITKRGKKDKKNHIRIGNYCSDNINNKYV